MNEFKSNIYLVQQLNNKIQKDNNSTNNYIYSYTSINTNSNDNQDTNYTTKNPLRYSHKRYY